MTEDNTDVGDPNVKQYPGPDDPDGYTKEDVTPKEGYLDLVLDLFVGFADEHRGAVWITITSNGAVLSGIAISRSEWIERLTDQLRASGYAGADQVREVFDKMQQEFVDEWNRRDSEDLTGITRGFIHLRDVRVLSTTPPTELSLWRGALADVTGWSLGSWNPPASAGDSEVE